MKYTIMISEDQREALLDVLVHTPIGEEAARVRDGLMDLPDAEEECPTAIHDFTY
jgi:hypothetical protein